MDLIFWVNIKGSNSKSLVIKLMFGTVMDSDSKLWHMDDV